MYGPEISFERTALYEEVWETPLTRLGQKYGLSDNGVRKICKAMNIPLPKAGHWARVAAGQRVERSPLPAETPREEFFSYRSGRPKFPDEAATDKRWLEEKLAVEARPENLIVVNLEPTQWHRLVAPLKTSLEKAQQREKVAQSMRDKAAKARAATARSGGWQPNLDAYQWWYAPDPGGMLINRLLPNTLRVSHVTFSRALAIANAIAFAAEARGCSVSIDQSKTRMNLAFDQGKLSISIEERQETQFDSAQKKDTPRPTDQLAVVVMRPSGSKFELVDTEAIPVQQQLNVLFEKLYRNVASMREKGRQDSAKRAAFETRMRELEAQRHQEALKAKAEAEEARWRTALIAEAAAWHKAQQIRTYIDHVIAQAPGDISKWSERARRVADEMDPLPGRVAAFSE